jgi:tetraacyldisaccharide 4'-kinase
MKFFRLLLLPFSLLYSLILQIRNGLYDHGLIKSYRPELPVICIGNLALGGTGKTPHTEYLIRMLKDELQVATLSRGYGRKTKGFYSVSVHSTVSETGDEPLQFKKKFGDAVIVAVDENRKEGIQKLLAGSPQPDVILLDDAFQHRQVRAGFNILLTSFTRPYTSDFVLPAGNLREPRSGAARADIVIITKCPESISEQEQDNFRRAIPGKVLFFSSIRYGTLISLADGSERALPRGESKTLLLSGIADNSPLQHFLRQHSSGLEVLEFPDHHDYSASDLIKLRAVFEAMSGKNNIIVTTEKDAMRLRQPENLNLLINLPIYYVPIHIEFKGDDSSEFHKLIHRYVNENKKRC